MTLWRHPDFMRLWTAQTISQFGSQITFLALPLAAILVLKASAYEVAVLGVLEWAPWLLLSLPAGAWVDRMPRRPVLIAADVDEPPGEPRPAELRSGPADLQLRVPLRQLPPLDERGQVRLVGHVEEDREAPRGGAAHRSCSSRPRRRRSRFPSSSLRA